MSLHTFYGLCLKYFELSVLSSCMENHFTFTAKETRKTIVISIKLNNKSLKDKNEQWRNDYRKQRNLCITLIRRARQQYFFSLGLSLIAYNKRVLENSQTTPFDMNIISLTKDGKTITDDLKIAETFSNYFNNVIRSLYQRNVPTEPTYSQNSISTVLQQSINSKIIPTSSLLTKTWRIGCPSFAFEFVSLKKAIKEINKLSTGYTC